MQTGGQPPLHTGQPPLSATIVTGALAPTQGSGQQTGQPPADGPAAETVADGQGVTQLGREAMLRIERNRAAAMARRVRNLEVQKSDASTEAPMCAICKDQLHVTDDKYALPCAHAFHTESLNGHKRRVYLWSTVAHSGVVKGRSFR